MPRLAVLLAAARTDSAASGFQNGSQQGSSQLQPNMALTKKEWPGTWPKAEAKNGFGQTSQKHQHNFALSTTWYFPWGFRERLDELGKALLIKKPLQVRQEHMTKMYFKHLPSKQNLELGTVPSSTVGATIQNTMQWILRRLRLLHPVRHCKRESRRISVLGAWLASRAKTNLKEDLVIGRMWGLQSQVNLEGSLTL